MGRSSTAGFSALLALGFFASASWAGIEVRVEGVSDELQAAVRNNLDAQHYQDRQVSKTEAQRLFAGVEEQAIESLRPYGYYHAQAQGRLSPGDKDGDYIITVQVE